MPTWPRYVIGVLIAIHGYVYIPFAFYRADELQRSHGTSMLLGPLLSPTGRRTATIALHTAAGSMLLVTGLWIVFAPAVVPAWRTLAVAGGATGVLAFLLAWNGRTTHLSQQGLPGATASLAIAVAALAFEGWVA